MLTFCDDILAGGDVALGSYELRVKPDSSYSASEDAFTRGDVVVGGGAVYEIVMKCVIKLIITGIQAKFR